MSISSHRIVLPEQDHDTGGQDKREGKMEKELKDVQKLEQVSEAWSDEGGLWATLADGWKCRSQNSHMIWLKSGTSKELGRLARKAKVCRCKLCSDND